MAFIAAVTAPADAAAQSTLLADTYVSAQRASTNYGALSNLYVSGYSTALVRFDTLALPPDATAATVGRAVLRVYLNRVNTPGTLAVAAVNGDWREGAVTSQTLPRLNNAIDTQTAAAEGQYVAFDVTALVRQWIAAPATNYGFALSTTAADVVVDSKESDATAHPATLDIVMLAAAGTAGPKGDEGDRGDTGPQGPAGPTGPAGTPGATGVAGSQGAAGPQGVAGPQGPAGTQGTAGTPGAQGPKGDKGDAGGLSYRGTWSSTNAYALQDVVAYNGAAWVSLISANTNSIPSSTSSTWGVLVPAAGAAGGGTGTAAAPAVGLVYKGVYASATTYAANEVVTYSSAAWVSLAAANTGNVPFSGSGYWAVLVPAPVANTTTAAPTLSYKGAYTPTTSYGLDDVVTYKAAAWVSISAGNYGNPPDTSTANWAVLVPAAVSTTGGTTTTATPSLSFKGAYGSTTNYGLNDVVTWQSGAWVSISSPNYGNTPSTSAANWAILVPAASSSSGGGSGTTPPATPSLSYKGAYASTTNYGLNDVVTWQAAAWVSISSANHGNTPSESPANWAVLVPAAGTGGTTTTVVTKNLAYQGNYASITNYAINDVVTWQSTAWISLTDSNHGNTPDSSPYAWSALVPAAVGIQGAQGPRGDMGYTGPQGERGYTGEQGPQGERGATGATGRPGFVYQGAYQSATNYTSGDVVIWLGSSWASLVDSNHGNTPSESPTYWGMLTSTGPKGDKGDTGAVGPQGATGLTGMVGPPGETGMTGPIGSTGPQGQPGRDGAQGPAGERGPVGLQGVPGPVGLTWQGTYTSATNYAPNDAVTWQGQSWLSATAGNHGNTPGTTADWVLLAAAGAIGPQGAQGNTGPQGATGDTGATGAQGPQGQQGPTGPQGEAGMYFQGAYDASRNYALHDAVTSGGGTWLSLTAGNHGNTPGTTADWVQLAAPGATGSQGQRGQTGDTGQRGDKGDAGSQGPQGPAGNIGPQGPPATFRGPWSSVSAYVTGDAVSFNGSSWVATAAISGTPPGSAAQWSLLAQAGADGVAGAAGPQGPQGQTGGIGPQGNTGPQGAPGLQWRGAYAPQTNYAERDAVSYNGSSYVSLAGNNTGNTPGSTAQWAPLAVAGANGSNGTNGQNGAAGAAATIAVRNVTSGTVVAVTNAGTAQAAVFDFVLPKGDTGATGPTGPAGILFRGAWSSGTGYSKGDSVTLSGSSYVSLVNTNTTNPATDVQNVGGNWALLASQGATGPDGAATVAIGTVTTGAPGSSATITNSGTSTAARLNFTLPRGDTGATGAVGLLWRGAWDTGTQYAANDAVSYAGSAWVALSANRATQPTGSSLSATAWSLLAAQGATGPQGATPTFSIGTVTTGAAGSTATVTLNTSGTANTLSFMIPRGDKGDTGAAGSGGGTGNGTTPGASFTAVHTLPNSDSGVQYYSAQSDKANSVDLLTLMIRMPDRCSVSTIRTYSTGAAGLSLELRAATTPSVAAMTSVISCSSVLSGASSCSPDTAVDIGGKFVDLRIGSASTTASTFYTMFTCN